MKKTVMPPPTNDHDNKDVHVVTLPLFRAAPVFTQVKQAPGIANCPVAAILAATGFHRRGSKNDSADAFPDNGQCVD
jgi:hypothetical protein